MSTVEEITEKVRILPAALQEEALHYVEFLLARRSDNAEIREWSRFSAEQLTEHYCEADAIYDQE